MNPLSALQQAYNHVTTLLGSFGKPKVVSPIPQYNIMTPAMQNYVKVNESREQAARQVAAKPPPATPAPKGFTYNATIANGPTQRQREAVQIIRQNNPNNKMSDAEIIAKYNQYGEKLLQGLAGGPTRAPSPTQTPTRPAAKPTLDMSQAVSSGGLSLPGQAPVKKIASPQEVKGANAAADYIARIRIANTQNPNGFTDLPPEIAQVLLGAFDDINEATNAARVLHHPKQQTYTQAEIKRYGHPSVNYGENASFRTGPEVDSVQSDGSVDRGLMRINSNTFNGLMARHPDWMAAIGVTKWDDMLDPAKNAQVARLILRDSNYNAATGDVRSNPNWARWFAAPYDLRTR